MVVECLQCRRGCANGLPQRWHRPRTSIPRPRAGSNSIHWTDPGTLSIFDLLDAPAGSKLSQLLKKENACPDRLQFVITQHRDVPATLMDLEFIPLDDQHRLLIFKDSSRRLRLEAHVQRLVTAVDATPDHFLVTDAELRITYVNPAFQSATGYCLEEVLGRSDEFLRAPTEVEKVNAYRDLVSQGREWFGELVNQRRNGELYHVECTVSPIADIADRFMGYVVCERDITNRRQLQGALRAERDFVQSILHSLDGAIYSLDCEFRLTHTNAGWQHLPALHAGIQFGGPPALGQPLLDHVPEAARRGELRLAFEEVMATGKPQDNFYHSPDGRYWLMRISPWIDGPNIRGLICNIADQTQFHELQAQLFQAQKMEIIGTLAAGVAHDFNNLLQAIRGNTGLILLEAAAGSSLRLGLEKIDLAAARAADITSQLLTFSRISRATSARYSTLTRSSRKRRNLPAATCAAMSRWNCIRHRSPSTCGWIRPAPARRCSICVSMPRTRCPAAENWY